MKKFLAFISAILLALLIVGGILAWKGVDFKNFSFKDLFGNGQQDDIDPKIPETDIQTPPDDELNLSYEERMEKGDYYFERGFLSFASSEYAKASNLEPQRIDPYLKLIDTHFELRDYSKALVNAEQVLQLNPNHLETRFDTILIHIKLSDFETAKNLLDTYPTSDTTDAKVLYYQGLLMALFDDHDEAQKLLKQAQVASTDAVLSENISEFLGSYQEFSFTQAGEAVYLSELLARSYNKATEYEMAIHLLKETLKERGDLRDGWILLGFAYMNLERYEFARTALEKAYSLDSEWSNTQYFLGITHKNLENADQAIIFFNLALSNNFEPTLLIYRHLADLYFETQNYEKAAEAYEEILKMSKTEDVNSFIRPVWLYIDYLENPDKALKLAEASALAFPESAMSYNLIGWSYIGLEEEKKAENNLKKAIEIDPNLAAAHYNLANLYRIQNRNKLALEGYQTAYNLDTSGSIGNMAAKAYNELLQEGASE